MFKKIKIDLPFIMLIFLFPSFITGCKIGTKDGHVAEDINVDQNPLWAVKLIEAYAALSKERNMATADLLFDATNGMPRKNWENYLVCAIIYVPEGEYDKAFMAMEEAIDTGMREVDLLNSIPELSPIKSDSRWEGLIAKIQQKKNEYLETVENPKLLKVLENMWAKDQIALAQYEEHVNLLDSLATNEDYARLFERVETRWEINRKKLDSIIATHGWPGNRLVGEDGSKIAWAIPQHHPNIFFKQKCQELIKEAVEKGDSDPNHYAELTDRIARDTWQKQVYGSSMAENAPHPIKDVATVNERRFELGLLEPIEVYAYYHGIEYRLPTKDEAKQQSEEHYNKAQRNYTHFENFLKAKAIDSALTYIKMAIKSHGDLSNQQLFQAALKLGVYSEESAKKLSIRILKVLIWRKWDKRFEAIVRDKFLSLEEKDWNDISQLLNESGK
ncbi:hypothetical protein FK220_016070 [Flavobacteriaceae bacterium TP-CH-4]|uniref:Lipoprotein n=1 Tax=Pelagihabitans pacificus TaxID=2696054 RepID=A0A967EC40_9FLAO|nr:DUF6624 domain-containing protein [Pelagihabitans pacificus]NHF60871.1 hypothetical protein [Pelagihabitans pacificus]